jgi:hypothetical protein
VFNIDEINNYNGPPDIVLIKKWFGMLHTKITELEKSNDEKQQKIDTLTKRLDDLQPNQPSNDSPLNTFPISYASISAKKTVAERQIVAAIVDSVSRNDKEKSIVEKNIIISGIQPTNNEENDKREATAIIEKLSIGDKVQNVYRIKKWKDKKQENTSMFKVVLDSVETRNKAFESIKSNGELKKLLNEKKIFINKDMTSNQRITFNKLLNEKNERNKKLKNEKDGKKFDIDPKTGKKYFWVIRDNDTISRFYIKED